MLSLWVSHGRQTLVKLVSVVVNWALPLDVRLMLVYQSAIEGVSEGERDGGKHIVPVIADDPPYPARYRPLSAL